MQIIKYPERKEWEFILKRPHLDLLFFKESVKNILQEVKTNGDNAIKQFTQNFDGIFLEDLRVTEEEMKNAETVVSIELKKAIKQAADNIALFHEKQITREEIVETMP